MKHILIAAVLLLSAAVMLPAAAQDAEFTAAIEARGGITNDLSDSKKIALDEPSRAYVNISGISDMPQAKTDELHAWLEFFDGRGNYFKKRIIAGAQGNSSFLHPKKNIKIDICEDEWVGDKTTDITFGSWVKQDAFHLKAYFTDYFRGMGAVCYKIFDDVIADRGDMAHPWQRAGVTDADPAALCHPEGFPAAVYLNGQFYGVYSWQLKKHRKNMGQDKNNPLHIHLDGQIFFFYNNFNWADFEVRNPKTLYCQDGSKYDGDNPSELMGADSPAYDPSNADHVNSASVKEAILALSRCNTELNTLRASGMSPDDFRREFERRFDVQGLIDYTIFSSVVNNADGWFKNWQFITYDGVKWFIEPYDLDMSFGNQWFGYYTMPAEYITYDTPGYRRFIIPSGPAEYIHSHYADELDRRYAELRDAGVLTPEAVKARVRDWYDRVGQEYYDLEYARWPQSYCIRDMVVDDAWEWAGTWDNYSNIPDWDGGKTYIAGKQCRAGYMIFTATRQCKNRYPIITHGYRDGIDRINSWIDRRFDLQDFYWNYDLSKDPFAEPGGIAPAIVPADADASVVAVHNLAGVRLTAPSRGFNIITYSDGRVERVILP